MRVVNFIADPWERAPNRTFRLRGHPFLLGEYKQFKSRLHWLLLWNDQVRILDTFALFNRQIERWVTESHQEGPNSKDAIRKLLGDEKAISIVLRAGSSNETFSTLSEVDEAYAWGNEHFVWYPDGPPTRQFVRQLDRYLGLPRHDVKPYQLADHTKQMCVAFDAALKNEVNPTDPSYEVHSEFKIKRELLPADKEKQLRELIGDKWTRSRIYTVLGYGVNRGRRVLKPRIDLRPEVREILRRLADACYYRAINHDLSVACRFPCSKPPTEPELLFPVSSTGSITAQEEASLPEREELFRRKVGAVCLTGDVGPLFRGLADLPLREIVKLRKMDDFRKYRELYDEFERTGEQGPKNIGLLREIITRIVPCLNAVGTSVGVSIERTMSSPFRVCFSVARVGRRLLATGLTYLVNLEYKAKTGQEVPFPIPEFLVESAIQKLEQPLGVATTWLSARFQRIEVPSEPIRFTVDFSGSVKTSDIE